MKAKITITFEYEIVPDYYPEGAAAEECLAIDLANFKDDPCEALANFDFVLKGELID